MAMRAMGWRRGLAAAAICATAMATYSWGQAAEPEAPQPQTLAAAPAQLQPMPAPDPANFTASTPTRETVDQFLKQSWGYDSNRLWQIQAIQTTQVPGLSRVTVLVEEKGGQQAQPSALVFLTLPDGKHLISNDEVTAFGPHPFEEYRQLLRQDAKGPSRGPANASLWLVEFADFECPHCKEAQPTVDRLLKDFPDARYVAQSFPLRNVHTEAEKAAEAGACVAKIGGSEAYFKFAEAAYADQASLTPQGSAQALQAAVTAAGVDQAKVTACLGQPGAKEAVDASLKLGQQVGVNSTPTLFVNGRALPGFGSIPYDTLKRIVSYQMQIDSAAK
jgi:protein-disulfide isomerase